MTTTDIAADATDIDWAALGAAIRERRRARRLTLVELAGLVGLSQPFLSQIENGRARPSMESLARLASALGSTPQSLFGGMTSSTAPVLVRSGDAHVVAGAEGAESVCKLLVTGGAPVHLVEYDGLPSEFREYWAHDGFEAAYVVAGAVEVDVAGEVTRLAAGDTLSYPAHLPHRHRAVGRGRARLLLIETTVAHGAP